MKVRSSLALSGVVLFAAVLAAGSALAAPMVTGVTGTIADEQAVTVTGSGFGTKNPAAPVIWANFEGNIIRSDPNLSLGVLNSQGVSLSTGGEAGSSYATRGRADLGNVRLFTDLVSNYPYARQRYLYIFNKRKYDAANFFGSNTNYKTHREHPTCSNGLVDFVITLNANSSQAKYLYTWEPSMTMPLSSAGIPLQRWFGEELELDKGTLNASNAGFRYYQDGARIGSDNSGQGVTSASPDYFGCADIQNLVSGNLPAAGAYVYMDDLYIDTTWARVMIGNASTFSASTRREIQIPTAWTSSSITIRLNQGGFGSLNDTYLYVIDAAGNVNSTGYRLSPTYAAPPSAPTNLRVQ